MPGFTFRGISGLYVPRQVQTYGGIMKFTDWHVGSTMYHKLANQLKPEQWFLLQKIAKSAYEAGRKQGRKDANGPT